MAHIHTTHLFLVFKEVARKRRFPTIIVTGGRVVNELGGLRRGASRDKEGQQVFGTGMRHDGSRCLVPLE